MVDVLDPSEKKAEFLEGITGAAKKTEDLSSGTSDPQLAKLVVVAREVLRISDLEINRAILKGLSFSQRYDFFKTIEQQLAETSDAGLTEQDLNTLKREFPL